MLDLIGLFIGTVAIPVCLWAIFASNTKKKPVYIKRKDPIIKDCYWTRK